MRRLLYLGAVVLVAVAAFLLVRGAVPCEVLAAQPACEVALRPGPSEDTLTLVTVDGVPVFPPEVGELRLTTVAVEDELSFRSWLRTRTSTVDEVVPRQSIYPPGVDRDEIAATNAATMADSQLVATVVALESLGYRLEGEGARVARVTADAVTDELVTGDVIVAIDGQRVRESHEAVEAVRAREPGEVVVLEVRGEDGRRTLEVTLGSSPEAPGTAYVGVLLTTELDLPVDVAIEAGPIGGPSAGLMFALSVVELLEEGDLVDGRVVAGTGTLARDGRVGAVGGIRQKLAGASDGRTQHPADVFLVPEGNLDEARRAPVTNDLLVVPVGDLSDAVAALEALRDGREPAGALLLAAP